MCVVSYVGIFQEYKYTEHIDYSGMLFCLEAAYTFLYISLLFLYLTVIVSKCGITLKCQICYWKGKYPVRKE